MPRGSFCLVAMMCFLGAACTEGPSATPVPSASVTAPSGPAAGDIVAATTAAGDARVVVQVKAHMPSEFDDGDADRKFSGDGFIDQERGLAGVNYDVADVPNSAGYFGHVDPSLSVFYDGPTFLASFPELAQLLPGPVDWLEYELSAFNDPKLLKLGIGQLREIGLSDPRLATALLEGATGELQPGGSLIEEGVPYSATVDVQAAADAAPTDVAPVLEELVALGVSTVDAALAVGGENRLAAFSYSLSYPPKEGSKPVRLRVTIHFEKYGLKGGLTPPRPSATTTIQEYLSL